MLQKIIMVLVSVFTMIASSIAPTSLLGVDDGASPLTSPGAIVQESLSTTSYTGSLPFARVSILSASVDGRAVFEDAWGQGTLQELSFKVGVKPAEGNVVTIGETTVPLTPTDTITVRNFRGKFEFRGIGTSEATVALDGTVETTVVAKGDAVRKIRTQVLPSDDRPSAPVPNRIDLAYITLDSGEAVNTVTWETGAGARLYTWAPTGGPTDEPATSVLAKWIKIDGREVRAYTWGDGVVTRIEFEPTERATLGALVNWSGDEFALQPRRSVVVEGFVGSYTVHEVAGGGMSLRLDGFAESFTSGDPTAPAGVGDENVPPTPRWGFHPPNPTTTDYVTFEDLSSDPDGLVVFREWTFSDSGRTDILPTTKHKFTKPGRWAVTLSVTDNALATESGTFYVDVANTPPVADWDFHPKDVYAGDNVRFEDKSWDPDDATGVASVSWNLGDGSNLRTEKSFVHAFARPGNYTATLKVTDEAGDENSLSKVVVVRNRPPVPSFSLDPNTPLSKQEVRFTDESIDRDGTVECWRWDFGDGTTSELQHPTKSYLVPGTFLVNLTVCDDSGAEASTGLALAVENRPPEAAFTYSPPAGSITSSTLVQFVDASTDLDNRIVEWRWSFGDGSSTDLRKDPTHRFFRPGTYNTCLTVKDEHGAQRTACETIPVGNSAPVAQFTWSPRGPESPVSNQSISFIDQSHDPDGDPIVEWSWTFGDGSPTVFERSPTHRFPVKGSFLTTLRVTDNAGNAGSRSQTVTIFNDRPTVAFTFTPPEPTTVQDVTFHANATDSDGVVVAMTWDWGDGSIPEVGTDLMRVHRFGSPGTYDVRLTARDNDGGERTVVRQVVVRPAAPSLAFSWSPLVPQIDEAIQFTDETVPNDVVVASHHWSFGDGGTSSEQHPQHAYSRSGTYPVMLTVRDTDGAEYQRQLNLRVNVPPVASFLMSASSVPLGGVVRFTDQSSDPDGSVATWRWNFGDGSPQETGSGPHEHTFTVPGSHVVTLTITDNDGGIAIATRDVNVANRPPIADFTWSPATPRKGDDVSFTDLSRDPDEPNDAVEAWSWSFGEPGAASNLRNPVHRYATSGLKTVTLAVSDGQAVGAKTKAFRVTSDHDVTVRICSRLPDGRLLDHARESVGLFANLSKIGAPGADLFFAKGDPKVTFLESGCADVAVPAGEWAASDRFSYRVVVFGAPSSADGFVDLKDADTLVLRTLRIPLPLVPGLEIANGTRDPAAPPLPPAAPSSYPTYRDPTEPVRVGGEVAWADGTPSKGVRVRVEMRHVGLRALQSLPDGLSNHPPWCTAAYASTDAFGTYDVLLPVGPACLVPGSDGGAFLPGWYQVRVTADCDSCDPPAIPGTSPIRLFHEDPLGVLNRAGATNPP